MGIMFRGNSTLIGVEELDLPVLEGYGCSDGYLLSMADCLYNEGVDFNDSMSKEFNEVVMEMKKNNLEEKGLFTEASNIEIITESASDIIEKLKELIRKLGAKINSIYEAVKVRVMSFLTKDYNKFYTSNKDKFNKKYSKFKGNIKWMQPTSAFTGGLKFNNINSKINKDLAQLGKSFVASDLDKYIEEVKDGNYLDKLLSTIVPNTDKKSFKKDFKEALFEDKDKIEGVSSTIYSEVNKILGTKDIIKNLNDAQKKNKDLFKTTINSLNKIEVDYNNGKDSSISYKGSDGAERTQYTYTNNSGDGKRITLVRSRVLALQTACNLVNGEYISLTKSHIAQCKAVFTKVCSFITEQTLLDAVEECVYDEVLEELEAV